MLHTLFHYINVCTSICMYVYNHKCIYNIICRDECRRIYVLHYTKMYYLYIHVFYIVYEIMCKGVALKQYYAIVVHKFTFILNQRDLFDKYNPFTLI